LVHSGLLWEKLLQRIAHVLVSIYLRGKIRWPESLLVGA
jgi:hypothetical protein